MEAERVVSVAAVAAATGAGSRPAINTLAAVAVLRDVQGLPEEKTAAAAAAAVTAAAAAAAAAKAAKAASRAGARGSFILLLMLLS